jgi:NADH-quinone oxidoreductase subunit A
MFATYLSIIIMVIAGIEVAAIFLALSAWFGAKRTTPEKLTTYESGVEPVGTARNRFMFRFLYGCR